MSKEQSGFAGMFEALEREGATPGRRGPRLGDEVSGVVVRVGSDAVYVDLGGKSEGLIERAELLDPEGNLRVAVGDRVRAFVVAMRDGATILGTRFGSRAAQPRSGGGRPAAEEVSPEIGRAFESGLPIAGRVKAVNKGGVEVDVLGAHAFCPISQLDRQRVEDASGFVGQELSFQVVKFETGGGRPNIVLSRRAVLDAERAERAAEVVAKLEIGAVVRGTVVRLQPFGAFVDIGGVEGLLHKSELGIGRNARIEQALSVGQEIEAILTKIEPSDDPKKSSRIGLSMKQVAAHREAEDAKSYQRPTSGNMGTLADVFAKLKR